MGTYLSEPKTQKKIQMKRFDDCFVTTCEMQGWRKQMEDAIIYMELAKGVELFAIFDGHGGPEISNYVAKILPKQLANQPQFKLKNYNKALTNTFKRVDQMLKSKNGQQQLRKLRKQLNIYPNIEENEIIGYRAGCTANVILLTKEKIYTANIGDSRSVLCQKNKAIALSQDHKPQNPIQRKRIQSSGGYIKNGRVNGGVNLTRAFGDFQYKSVSSKAYNQQPLISVPDIVQRNRQKQDSYIIMGCDGIWQRYVKDNQKMIQYIKSLRQKYLDKKIFIQNFVNSLLAKNAQQQCGLDNMSVIFIDFI